MKPTIISIKFNVTKLCLKARTSKSCLRKLVAMVFHHLLLPII